MVDDDGEDALNTKEGALFIADADEADEALNTKEGAETPAPKPPLPPPLRLLLSPLPKEGAVNENTENAGALTAAGAGTDDDGTGVNPAGASPNGVGTNSSRVGLAPAEEVLVAGEVEEREAVAV